VTPEYWSIANREWESSSTYDPACIGVYKVALDVALPEITEAEAFAIMHAMKYEYYQGRINGFVYRVLGDDHPEYWSGALNNWISSGANNGEVRTFESITKTQAFASIAQPNFSSCKP
jgi:hypothetical protein